MRTLQASTLVTLLLLASLSAVFPHALATDTTIKGETTWSGAVLLTGNVTVANGTTLNIKPGTTIDGGDDHWILVKGTLIANDATFSSSHTPLTQGSHGAGLWVGLHVSATGHAVLTNVIINNAKTAVRNDGQLTGSDLTINDAYIGINNAGTATVANLTANDIDYDAVRNSGDFTVEEATITRVAGGVISSGTATISDASFIQAGSALRATAGQFDATRIGFDTVTVGIASQAGASMSVSSLTGTSVALTVDAGNSDDLTLSNMVIEGHRLMLASGATMVSGHDITFAGNLNETRATIDQRCSGACSWSQTTLTNVVWGLALSGGGTHTLSNVTAVATERNLDASGTGAVIATQLNLSGSDAAISLRGPDSDIDGASISLVSANSIGLDVLDGIHEWKNVELSKPYSSQDATSIGVKAWYSTIAVQALSITHFATGIDASDATITGNTITVADGKMTGIALHDSDVTVDSLSTRVFTTGVHMEGASTLHVTDWLADLHATPLNLDTDCTATVRNFQPQNTQASSSDALGDGSLLYGGSTTASIATSSSDFFEETPVTFTDLAGSPVEATILVHGFTLMSNSNGAATLPLLAQGSTVDVSLGGAGIRVVLYGATMGQSVQVAVVPQGDWTITSGQIVYLGARPDGSPHVLSGDLTLETGSGLQLDHTTLLLPSTGSVSVEGTAQLFGDASIISAQTFTMGLDSTLSSSNAEDGLIVIGNVSWACQTLRTSEYVHIQGHLMLQPGCKLDLIAGTVSGAVSALTGAELNVLSKLAIRVLDQGTPVEGALISVDGAVASTGTDGRLSTTAIARKVTDSSEMVGGIKNINLQIGSFTDFVTWDSSSSFDHTFMASRIDGGTLEQWLVLESQWSPYFLDEDLMVAQTGTLTIDDGVSVRISEGHTITVDGTMNVGDATLSSTGQGARWGGMHLGELTSSSIDLSATSIFEASPALTVSSLGRFSADGSDFARSSGADPLIMIAASSNASVEFRDSSLYDAGSGCIKSFATEGLLHLTDLIMATCNGVGLWARQANIHVDGLTLNNGFTHGFELTAVKGSVANIDATNFDGSGYIGWIESIDGDFTLSNLNGTVGAMGGLAGANNRFLDLEIIQITGAPAVDFDNTAGEINGMILNGLGTGTAFSSHHGRSMDSLIVEGLSAANYAVAVDLHADENDGGVAPLILRSPDLLASSVLSAEMYPARIEGGQLVGEVAASGSITIDLVDVTADQTSVYNEAVLKMWKTFNIDAQVNGASIVVDFAIDTIGHTPSYSVEARGSSVLLELPMMVVEEGALTSLQSITVIASTTGLPIQSRTVNVSEDMNTTIVVAMALNGAPLVEILKPYSGQRVMETTPLAAEVTYSDDLDSIEDLVVQWIITDAAGDEVTQGPNESQFNITGLPYGFYVLEAVVTDALGASSSDTVDFEITQLDTDGDWNNDCIYTQATEVWFNAELGHPCGPDQQDTDDDNDGYPDARDDYPTDPCAWIDTDQDGQPDSVDCPAGMTTWLFADQDDDNDGVPDVMEGTITKESGDFSTGTLLLMTLIGAAILLFVLRMRNGGGDDIGELDIRHL
tara:strand:- start:14837 stop:19534 length:4698 start_codon:yes stop_codon:yes gene_type:complete